MAVGRRRLLVGGIALAVVVAAGGAWGLLGMTAAAPPRFVLPTPSEQFDPDQAFKYLELICRLGPRRTGSPAMKRQREVLRKHFEALGATVEEQEFTATQPSLRGKQFPVANLIARYFPERPRRVVLCCHYDTRPNADEEPPFRRGTGTFLGANDGGSGVALLMEFGRQLPSLPMPQDLGVDLVFVDAEEFVFTRQDSYFIGSEHHAASLKRLPNHGGVEAVVVLDMVAGRENMTIRTDTRSFSEAGPLVGELFAAARRAGARSFDPRQQWSVYDDHVSYLNQRIPAMVLSDMRYPHWHRYTDLPKNCSGESMAEVAGVLREWLRTRR